MFLGPLMLDLEGVMLSDSDIRRLQHPCVGGVILFSRNIESAKQVSELIAAIRSVRANIIVAVDQEGGRVQRIRQGVTRLPALSHLGRLYDSDCAAGLHQAHEWGWLMASEMLALGFDISFAPVLDLDFGRSAVIGDRSFHQQPSAVVDLGRAYIDGMHEAGMAATGKHFPGHGWVQADSHLAIPIDERDCDTLQQMDMTPFAQLSAVVDAVMPAHVIYPDVDDQPAGFSHHWLQTVLRQQLQFKGVIFSDDLTMEGASVAGGFAERAQAALDAGCDMVLVCNNLQGADEVLRFLEQRSAMPDQGRLQAMRARQQPNLESLNKNSRAQTVKAIMNSIG